MMKRLLVASIALFSMVGLETSSAAYDSPKEKCQQELKDVQDAYTARNIGEKASAEAEKLIEIAAHLCAQGNFVYADDLMVLIRTMLAKE